MPSFRSSTFLFVGFGVLFALGAFWGLPSALAPALDSIAPLGPLAFVAKYRQADITYVYPAVHQLIQVAAYAVVLLIAKLTGAIGTISSVWPYGFKDASAMFSVLQVVSNLISAVMAALLLNTLWRMRPDPTAAQWFAIPLLGLSGVYAFYARTANMDIPYLFWIVLAWHQLWLYLTANPVVGSRPLLLAGLFSALSVGSKDQASGIILGFGLLLLFCSPEGAPKVKTGWSARLQQAALFSAAVVVCYAVVAIAPQPARWWQHARFVTSDHVMPETPNSLQGHWELLVRCYWRLHHTITYAGLPLGLAGIALLYRRGRIRELALLVIPALAYYGFIIARVRATEERYLLPIAIPLVLCAGVTVGTLSKLPRRAKLAYALATATLAAQLVFSFVPVTYAQVFDSRRALQRDLVTMLPPGTPIALHSMQTYDYPNRYTYDQYRLMLWPGDEIVPPSTHAANLIHPFDPAAKHVFTRVIGAPEANDHLVRSWTYPPWIRSHIHVPAVHEFFLYEHR